MKRLIWAALIGSLIFSSATYAKRQKVRHSCFEHIVRAGIQTVSGHQAQITQQPRISELLTTIKRHNPHIDDYAEHFYASNGYWPTNIQIMRHLKRGHQKVELAIKEMMEVVDPQAFQLLQKLRKQISDKIEMINKEVLEANEVIYRLGDLNVKVPLRKLKTSLYGDLGELETWFHMPRPLYLNYDFSHSSLDSHHILREFERSRRAKLSELKKADSKQILELAQMKGNSIFHGSKDVEELRKRMIELLSTKEIDVIAQTSRHRISFIEVKNYNVLIEDIESTQYAKKSILTQLSEVRWVLEALGMRDQIDLGFIAPKGGIHPKEARKLLSLGVQVYRLEK